MLEVSLPEEIIEFFNLTCRNYEYGVFGGLLWTKEYKKGKLHGKITSCSTDFRNIRHGECDRECHGECDECWYDMVFWNILPYKNGKLHGNIIFYKRDGTFDRIEVYKNGKYVTS